MSSQALTTAIGRALTCPAAARHRVCQRGGVFFQLCHEWQWHRLHSGGEHFPCLACFLRVVGVRESTSSSKPILNSTQRKVCSLAVITRFVLTSMVLTLFSWWIAFRRRATHVLGDCEARFASSCSLCAGLHLAAGAGASKDRWTLAECAARASTGVGLISRDGCRGMRNAEIPTLARAICGSQKLCLAHCPAHSAAP